MDSIRALFEAFVVLQIVQPLILMTSYLDLHLLVSTMLPNSLVKVVDIVVVAVVVVDDDVVAAAAGDDYAAVYYSVTFVVYLNSNSNRRTR